MSTFPLVSLGRSDLRVTPVCLGTMTFGEQVDQADAHAILDHAVERGLNFIDTAEMYSVPTRAQTYGATERIIGAWVAGPSRNMDWVRNGSADLTKAEIVQACDDSLKRLGTDVIDLYQIHWPARNVPTFGNVYFDPAKDRVYASIQEQLEGMATLVKAGKVRHIGVSNESSYGVAEFVRVAEQHGLPRIATVQNPYALTSRSLDNGLDETMFRLGVSLLAYSPLAFGALSGKYDTIGLNATERPGRLAIFEAMKKQRWGRPEALDAARRYNVLAREHGLTPTRMALAFCYTSWRVTSTIVGVTTKAQLDENLAAWGTKLSAELLERIDAIRWTHRDPAQ